MLIAIIGAGVIGCLVGGKIHQAGAQVVLIGRERLLRNLETSKNIMSTKLLRDRESTEHKVGSNGLSVSTGYESLRKADIIIVLVKNFDTQKVANDINKEIAGCEDSKIILTLQNGVKNKGILRQTIDQRHSIFAGLVEFNAVWEDNMKFSQTSDGQIRLEKDPSLEVFYDFVAKSGIPVAFGDNIAAYQYGKLVLNLNNAVNALSGIPLIQTLSNPDYRRVVALCAEEAVSVFKQANIEVITSPIPAWLLIFACKIPQFIFNIFQPVILRIDPSAKLSMLQDLERGNKTEIDFLNGIILEVANEYHLPTPKANKTVVDLVHEITAGTRKLPVEGSVLLALCSNN